jgi:hypothetical protein
VFKSLSVKYQSEEDFRECIDTMHCTESFHSRDRYDWAILNTDVQFARVEGLFRCYLPSGNEREVVLVRGTKPVKWRPSTSWDNLQVMEETSAFFIAPRYVVRGALLVNTDLEKLTSTRYYVDDAFDNDMFLRLGN